MKNTPIAAILIVSLMLIAVVPSTVQAYTPRPTKNPVEPNPALEGNVTFSNHTAGQAPLEYVNQYGKNANLTAVLDPRTPNPLTIGEEGIIAPGQLQDNKIGGTNASALSLGTFYSANAAGVSESSSVATVNGVKMVTFSINSSLAGPSAGSMALEIPRSAYPSTNYAFDYVTISVVVSPGTTGATVSPSFYNDSAPYHAGETSASIAQYSSNGTFSSDAPSGSRTIQIFSSQGFYITVALGALGSSFASSTSNGIGAGFNYNIPKASGSTGTAIYTITAVSLSVYPLTLGPQMWNGSVITNNFFVGPVNLTALSPTFAYQGIEGGHYTAAIEQPASVLPPSSINIAETPISSGLYAEQLTYSFLYGMPLEPSLTYGAFRFVDRVNLAPAQYVSVTYAGTSYLTDYTSANAKGNYTTLVESASPTTPESWVGTVQYTQAQWNSISSPPGIFTVAGINYLWFVLIGVVAGLVGLGSAWASKGESASRIRGRGR